MPWKKVVGLILVFGIQDIITLGEKAKEACKCYGETMLECHNIYQPRNRIRVPVDDLLFPHMVLIGFRSDKTKQPAWKCGGTLISNNWVLTAAHCQEDPADGEASVLRVGTATFEFEYVEDLVQERSIAQIVVHPEFRPPSKYNDIALMRPLQSFVLNRQIRLACLHVEDTTPSKLTATGFGTTVSGAASGSETLMKVDLDVIDSTICNKSMRMLIRRNIIGQGVIGSQICAGDYDNGGKDTCQGDSGGPLQYMPEHVDCVNIFPLHQLVGVTSFGRDCGRKMAPGVYTRVSWYINWIESIVWPD